MLIVVIPFSTAEGKFDIGWNIIMADMALSNYFLFSYYCAGIRAADLIQLRWGNVTASGRLHYQMGKNHKERDLLLVEQAIGILRHAQRGGCKATDYIFPLLSNDAEYAGYVTQADKDRIRRNLRHKMYQDISSKMPYQQTSQRNC